jgi:hypothetical protein
MAAILFTVTGSAGAAAATTTRHSNSSQTCSASSLTIRAITAGRAASDWYIIYTLQNQSSDACSLTGTPAFVDTTTQESFPTVDESQAGAGAGVVLQPGAYASFATDWQCCAIAGIQGPASGSDRGGWQFAGQDAPVADSSWYDPVNYSTSPSRLESLQVGPIQAGIITQSPLIPPGAGPQPRPASLSEEHRGR